MIAGRDGRPPAVFAEIDAWLAARVPPESGATIVHNDYRLGNVIVGPPGRVRAVLDWELATLGDPLFDVGYFLASYPVAGEPMTPTQELGVAALEAGYPTRAELAGRYATVTGRDLPDLRWYTVLALWKLAVLYEYGRRARGRWRRGRLLRGPGAGDVVPGGRRARGSMIRSAGRRVLTGAAHLRVRCAPGSVQSSGCSGNGATGQLTPVLPVVGHEVGPVAFPGNDDFLDLGRRHGGYERRRPSRPGTPARSRRR